MLNTSKVRIASKAKLNHETSNRETASEDAVEAMVEGDGDDHQTSDEGATRQREVGGAEEEPGGEEDLRPAERGRSEPAAQGQPPEQTSSPSPPTPSAANSDANLQGLAPSRPYSLAAFSTFSTTRNHTKSKI